MLATADVVAPLLRCPRTGQPLVSRDDGLAAAGGGPVYPAVDGRPVLIDFEDSVVDRRAILSRRGGSALHRTSYSGAGAVVKRLLSPSKGRTQGNVDRLVATLKARGGRPLVLVVGGGTVGQGMQALYDDPGIDVVGFDIYATELTQFVADGHHIPLADAAFDAVVVQAVLEHVLDPASVVGEIWRVLKPDGLVYAETPFMQHVHEGAYDFTRFTASGHRNLFRRFEEIDAGACGGPGVMLMWSVDFFVRSLLRSRAAGKAAKLAFFWAQYLDRLIPEAYALDAASGVYFVGTKSDRVVTPREVIAGYRGAQRAGGPRPATPVEAVPSLVRGRDAEAGRPG